MNADKDREDLMFYWTGELDAARRRSLDERMAREPAFKAEAERLFAVLDAVIGEPAALRRAGSEAPPELSSLPGFDAAAFFEEDVAPRLPRRPRWAVVAAAAILMLAAFVLGAQVGAPAARPAARREAARLQSVYRSSVKGEDGLARGLLALSALSRAR